MQRDPTGEKRLLLIDGNSIINRAYFALAGRSTLTAPDGTPTGALNTYLNIMLKYIEEVRPTHICTLFDRKEKTFRHEMYDGYKAKRKGMPEDLAIQMPLLKESLDALRIPRIELIGYEADDLIGTLSSRGTTEDFSVYILSGDKDDFQLINERTVVLMPVTKAGKTSTETYDLAAMSERYGMTPEEFITLKAIMGDPSDNIPGVKGIGEKGAKDLVTAYHTLDSIYEHVEEVATGTRKKLEESREMAYLSYDLSRIRCDAPIEVNFSDLAAVMPDTSRASEFFRRLGLRAMLKKLNLPESETITTGTEGEKTGDVKAEYNLPELMKDISPEAFLRRYQTALAEPDFSVCFDVTDVYGDGFIDLILCLNGREIYLFPSNIASDILHSIHREGLGTNPLDVGKLPIGYSVKNRFKGFSEVLPFSSIFDVEIAGYLLNQIEGSNPSFMMLFEHAVKEPFPQFPSDAQTPTVDPFLTELEKMANMNPGVAAGVSPGYEEIHACTIRVYLMSRIAAEQIAEIEKTGMTRLVYDIEMPLVLRLDLMERVGVHIDAKVLDDLHTSFTEEMNIVSERIYTLAGTRFNILSPKQLGTVLFETLGLASGRKNQGGTYSTDSDELQRLIDEHPVVREVLTFRQISKLDSTFVVGLRRVIDSSDGRVHSNFSQAMTNTGRLSSSEPNLQNIPIRTATGSQIRKAFTAPKGYVLLDADYSQIELRLLAHLSGDENMTTAFLQGEDIHTNTAMKIFGVTRESVLPYMRSAAKTVNFSIVYGISDFGLSTDLGVSFKEAHHYIDQYYRQYPRIREYLDSLKATGYEKGYVETMFGRRRIMKELKSPNRNLRMFGERAAMNTPVQGTAADIIKIAMVQVTDHLREKNLDARLILQVHDELLVECREDQAQEASQLLKHAMERAVSLDVPLIAEISVGPDWYACKNG